MLVLTQKAQMNESHLFHKIATETPQHSRGVSVAHTPKNCSVQHHLRLLGSRQDGGTCGSQQNCQGSTTTLKITQMFPASTCPESSKAAMKKWGLLNSSHCECRDPLQTVEHIITSCPKHRPLNGNHGLIDLDDETLDWLARRSADTWYKNLAK
ncbi:hypothetical protein ABVT39_002183 [Epinephelus coioides]